LCRRLVRRKTPRTPVDVCAASGPGELEVRAALPTSKAVLEIGDRCWPDVLERICRERLFTSAYQPILDTVRGVVCG
jgi:hypothetical protein